MALTRHAATDRATCRTRIPLHRPCNPTNVNRSRQLAHAGRSADGRAVDVKAGLEVDVLFEADDAAAAAWEVDREIVLAVARVHAAVAGRIEKPHAGPAHAAGTGGRYCAAGGDKTRVARE